MWEADGYTYLAIVSPLHSMGASCGDVWCASAGFIGRRLSLYVYHVYIEEKRPSLKAMFALSA